MRDPPELAGPDPADLELPPEGELVTAGLPPDAGLVVRTAGALRAGIAVLTAGAPEVLPGRVSGLL